MSPSPPRLVANPAASPKGVVLERRVDAHALGRPQPPDVGDRWAAAVRPKMTKAAPTCALGVGTVRSAARSADEDVGEAVLVEVAGGADGLAERAVRRARRAPDRHDGVAEVVEQHGRPRRRAAQQDVHRVRERGRPVLEPSHRADRQVVDAVAVVVPDGRDIGDRPARGRTVEHRSVPGRPERAQVDGAVTEIAIAEHDGHAGAVGEAAGRRGAMVVVGDGDVVDAVVR